MTALYHCSAKAKRRDDQAASEHRIAGSVKAAHAEMLVKAFDGIRREGIERAGGRASLTRRSALRRAFGIAKFGDKRLRSCGALLVAEFAHVEHRYRRHQADKDEEQEGEQAERRDQERPVPEREMESCARGSACNRATACSR